MGGGEGKKRKNSLQRAKGIQLEEQKAQTNTKSSE